MDFRLRHFPLALSFVAFSSQAKVCTFGDIQEKIQKNLSFNALQEGCQNETILVNDRVEILQDNLVIDGLLASGKHLLLKWDAGNVPASYYTRAYKDEKEKRYYLDTHVSCSGDIYNPWYVFNVRANNVQIKNLRLEAIPDGIHVSRGTDTLLRDIEFLSVCEDALTIRAARNRDDVDRTLVEHVTFHGGDDKVINNESGKVWIRGCRFYNSNRAVDGGNDDHYVAKKRGQVFVQNTLFSNVKKPLRSGDLSRIYSSNNVFTGRTITVYSARARGAVFARNDRMSAGTCDHLAFFSSNPHSAHIPQNIGPSTISLDAKLASSLQCRKTLDPKSEADEGEIVGASLWPPRIEVDFFNVMPDNSDP